MPGYLRSNAKFNMAQPDRVTSFVDHGSVPSSIPDLGMARLDRMGVLFMRQCQIKVYVYLCILPQVQGVLTLNTYI